MNVRFLGVGGAFDPEHGNSAAVVETGDETFTLIDCGGTTFLNLKRSGWVNRVTHVLITHMHDDHIGSLGSFIFYCTYMQSRKLELVYPPGLREPLHQLLAQQYTAGPISDRVTLRELSGNYTEPECRIGATQVEFLDTTGYHQPGMPSFGYLFRQEDRVIAYSGDIGDPDCLFLALEKRGIREATVFHDIIFVQMRNGPHAWYRDVEPHLDRWTIRGYHNNPGEKPSDCRIVLVAEDPEFCPQLPI